jgi:hypothetical protein
MSTSSIIMMIIGCGIVWGGAITTIVIALAIDKKKQLQAGANKSV